LRLSHRLQLPLRRPVGSDIVCLGSFGQPENKAQLAAAAASQAADFSQSTR